MEDLYLIGVAIPLLLVVFVFMFLPWSMAVHRGRSGFLWFLIGLWASPIIAIIILLVIGDAKYEGGKR